MDYDEAVKKLNSTKPKENYLGIDFESSIKFILPYKEGMQLVQSLANAEVLIEGYYDKPRIAPIERSAFRTFPMAAKEYERFKIAALMGVTVAELIEAELAQTKTK